jgi:hypothetical protein
VLYSFFLSCQMEQMVSREFDRVICMGLKTLRRKANGLKRVRSNKYDPLKTSSLSMMKKAISLLVSRENLGCQWLEPV